MKNTISARAGIRSDSGKVTHQSAALHNVSPAAYLGCGNRLAQKGWIWFWWREASNCQRLKACVR